MKKTLFAVLIILLLFSCDAMNDNRQVQDLSAPELPPGTYPEQNRLNVIIYTDDSVTVDGDIKLLVLDKAMTGEEPVILDMISGSSGLGGVTEWIGWVDLNNLGDRELLMRFQDSAGNLAQGIAGIEDPWWREVSQVTIGKFKSIDSANNIFEYHEIIRHWQNIDNGNDYSLSWTLELEDGSSASDISVDVLADHEINELFVLQESIKSGESFIASPCTIVLENLYPLNDESFSPLKDYFSIYGFKDFYHSSYASIEFSELSGQNPLVLESKVFAANRAIEIKWVYTDTGIFDLTTQSWESSRLNSVSRGDFARNDLGNYFFETHSSNPVDDGNGSFYFDNNQEIGFSVVGYFDSLNDSDFKLGINAFGGENLLNLGNSIHSTSEIDLTEDSYSWESYLSDIEEGQFIAFRSSIGYGIVEIKSVRTMTTQEMDKVIADFAASTQ